METPWATTGFLLCLCPSRPSRKASHPAIVVRAQGSQANIIGNDNVFVLILKPEKIFPLERLAKPH
ncbi:MAG: hypothetical protein J5846_06675, partial [Desulfovibrio sp.]|nr:hypothetical protein [Desulfovibrio sp.]